MELDWQSLVVQLGIAGLVVAVGYKIAVLIIEKWSVGDAARTKAIGEGFQAIVASHEKIIGVMNTHQDNELALLNDHATELVALNAKIDVALDLTPVRGVTRHVDPHAKVIVSSELEVPAERPRQQPRAQSSPGIYGPKKP